MLFGFGKKKETSASTGTKDTPIELKQKIEAHTEAFNIVLKQKNLAVKTARVCLVMDVSGSMESDFRRGIVQDVTERIMPLGLTFDDNGELEFFIFSNRSEQIESVTMSNIDGFVNNKVMPRAHWSGTNYAPVIKDVTKFYTKKHPSKNPTFVVFITDGDNYDKENATDALVEAAKYNIFWKFVGIGRARMEYLERLDTMEGRVVDNANFFQVKDIKAMSDDELYRNLLEEYGDWIGKASMLGIL